MKPAAATDSWSPTTTDAARRLRARVYRGIRAFFDRTGVLEVETPVLSRAGNTDPQIESLTSETPAGRRFLRTSPEFPMKRLLAAASGPIYELGRVFRAGEAGGRHNPEFTMLEWYRPGYDLAALADETVALIRSLGAAESRDFAVDRVTYRALIEQTCGLDPLIADTADLLAWLRRSVGLEGRLDRAACLDLLFSEASAGFRADRITVVSRFPACQCALARLDPDDDRVALRFEVFVGPLEIANGYDELYDAQELKGRFESENATRRERGQAALPLDEQLLGAVGSGIEAGSGVALGVDRLLMALGDYASIDDVISFPEGRA